MTGAVIANKYRLDATIGRGGVGVVYAATNLRTNERVAIKFLQLGLDDPNLVERFRREARAASRIVHPNVTRLVDSGEHQGRPYLVMEYLEGRDLEAILDDSGPLPVSEAVDYAMQACAALAEAHLHGVIHRDMKPANLFLARESDGSERVKLLDFGISKRIDASYTETALTTGFVGSPQYMAPEQLRKGIALDGRCDIWALGVTLYELLTGRNPFAGASVPLVCVAILKDAPASLRARRSDVPQALEAIVLRCLEKSRELRWPSVGALAEALEPYAASRAALNALPTIDPNDEIEHRIARLGGRDTVLALALSEQELFGLPLDPRGAFLLSRVDGTSTLDELLDVSGMPLFETTRLLCELYDQRAIVPVTARSTQAPTSPKRAPSRSGVPC